ncbi:hypothetical protein JRO89_XS08G0028800 [Xanthoceras sorbifolium]|uniref:Uncharacterized protein n=1 Tax=Xanthoceras sorbifolium TaxID=99658 RepID=A0ABQ8HNM9_9ROSI|nr:hypothetical protein JRO89_XS08G0028800 [Xanthoceras sorbifolium]
MQTVKSLQLQVLQKIPTKVTKPNLYMFSSLTRTPTQTPNSLFFNYLIQTLNFSKTEAAQSISNSTRFSNVKSLENPHAVLHYFRSLGLTETEIRSSVRLEPQILLSDVDRTLNRRLSSFEMGLVGSHLGCLHMDCVVSCLSKETFERKLELFRSFGFAKQEAMEMFQKQPTLFSKSEEQLKLTLDFFLNKIALKKELLFRRPRYLLHSLEGRVIPRYKVMQILKSKRLLKKKQTRFVNMLSFSEGEFLEKFVAKFRDDAEELLVAYKGHFYEILVPPDSLKSRYGYSSKSIGEIGYMKMVLADDIQLQGCIFSSLFCCSLLLGPFVVVLV